MTADIVFWGLLVSLLLFASIYLLWQFVHGLGRVE